MTFSEAYKRVTNWLALSGIEMESGKILDSKGCCRVSQDDNRDCVIVLPPGQTTLYFITSLYTPNLDADGDLIAFCLCLNASSLAYMKTAAIGLDIDNRQIILRNAHPLRHDARADFDSLLNQFLDQASEIRQQIKTFRQSGNVESSPYPRSGKKSFGLADTHRPESRSPFPE